VNKKSSSWFSGKSRCINDENEASVWLSSWHIFLFISFAKKKRTKESCPAICFSLRICYEMGRNFVIRAFVALTLRAS